LISLSLNATRELLAGRLGTRPEDAVVSACHCASGGNPFLIEEIAAALRAVAGPIGLEAVEALAAGRVASR
jgi:hypothetical protein